jgi:Protein of unknown function (DUF3592).
MHKVYIYNENPFQLLTLGPTAIAALFGLFCIIFLFPEWKKDIVMVLFLLLAVLLVSGGVFSICCGVLHARKVNWQIVSGIIVSSNIQKESNWRSTVDDRYLSGTKTVTYYVPYVVCKYSVLGKEYTNAMIAGVGTDGSDEAQAVLNQFPIGKEIDFYYDPKNPDNAVIEIPPTFSRLLPLIIGLILMPGGILVGWILMINLYNFGKADVSDLFKVPTRLEYQVNRAAVKIFKLPETEKQKLESYMKYLGSIKEYIAERGNYSKFYTRERVLSEQINTMERLMTIAQNDPEKVIDYGGELFDIFDRADRPVEARAVVEKIRDKYPVQFNASDLKNKLALDK